MLKDTRKSYRKTTATNKRSILYKYYKIDKYKELPVIAGRCTCSKITDLYCKKCYKYLCEKHLFTDEENYFCNDCNTNGRELTKKEIRKIRKAKL